MWRAKITEQTAVGQVAVKKQSRVPGVMITQFVENVPAGKSTPDFMLKPIALTIQEGKTAAFKAVVSGNPKPEVIWRRDKGEMADNQKFSTTYDASADEYLLEIACVSGEDGDIYKCFAVNEFGKAVCTAALNVIEVGFKRDKAMEGPVLSADPTEFRKLLRKSSGRVQEEKEPPKKEGEIDDRFWELLLSAEKKDYERICAEFGVTDFRWMLKKLNIMKREREEEINLYINVLSNLRHIEIKGEGSAAFELDLDLKDPHSRIFLYKVRRETTNQKYKDGVMIQYSRDMEMKHQLRTVGKKLIFTIKDLVPEDAGVYQVDVEDVNIFTTEFRIPNVDFVVKIQEVKAWEREDAIFECVLSRPFSKILWTGKNSQLENGDKYEITVSEDKLIHRLRVKDCKQVDKGIYTASAGIKACSAWLTVDAETELEKKKVRKTTQAGGAGLDLGKVAQEQAAKLRKENVDKREAMKKETEVIKECVRDGNNDGNEAHGLDGFDLRFGNDGSGLRNMSGMDADSGETKSTGTDCKSGESGLSRGELAAKNVTHTDKGSGDDKSGNIKRSPGPEVQVISGPNAKVGLPDENWNGSWSKDGKKIDDAGKCSVEKEVHRPETMLSSEGLGVQVLSGLSDMNAKAGQPAELICQLSKDNCDGSWSKDGKRLSPRDGLSLSKDGSFHKLRISSCQADDSGKYSFEAEGHKTEAMLTVEGPEVQFISGLSDMNAKVGQPAELVCKLSKENCSGSWSKDGEKLLPRDGVNLSNDGAFHKLKIESCQADDSGKYSFQAGGRKTEATLTVEGPEVQILSGLSDMNAKMGQPAELICKLSKDDCDGSWSKNGKKLSPRDGLSLSKDGAFHKLKINSCQEEDSGKYCFEAGRRKTEAIITVEGPEVQVLSGLSDIKVNVGQPAELVCTLSKENCDGSWSKDGKKLSSREGLTVSNDGAHHKLKIKSCCAGDAGKYSFEADGRKTEAIITVEVHPGPEVQVLSGLSDMNAKVGQPAELVCKLSKENCNGSWSKDGEKLSSGDRLTLSEDGASHKLKISSCQPIDTGKYSFEAEGCKTEAMIIVKDPEVQVLNGLSDVNAKVGQPAELVCKLSKENYNGTWRRDGKKLLPRDGLTLSKDGVYQKLKIDSCRVEDTGIYRFEAGGHKTEAVIIVEDPGAHFIRGLHDLDVKAGQSAELVVKLNKEDCSGSWFKDGSKLSPRDGLSLSKDGVFHKLKISSCQADDSGKYRFEADGHKSEAMVSVQGPEVQVISGLSSINVKVGQPAELVCKLNDENCSGVWFKDGIKLLPRDGMTLSKDGAWHKLKIDSCCVGDTGKYRFELGGRKTEATITVEDPPRFDKDDLANFCKPVIVKAGQNAIFKMPFAGDEHTKVQWFKEDEELQDKPNVKLEKTPSQTRLLLSSCQRKDSGEIKVKVKNDFGTIEAVSQLTVIDKPSRPQGPLEVVENSASCIHIKWRPPKDDGGSQLVGYALERQQVGRNTWMKLSQINSAATAYKDTSVEHGRKYCYRIRAVNEEGLGEPLETEGIMAGIKAYPGPPAPPKVVSAFSDCINLTWTAPTNTGGSQILGYNLEKRKKSSNMWSPINPQDEPIQVKQYAVKDIVEGMEYEFRVSAINVSGVGEPSIPSDLVTAKDPKKPPGKVLDLKVTDSSYTTLSLAWTKPNVEEGVQDEAKGYFVEIRPAESQEWTRCNTNPIIQTTFTVKGLKSMDIYWVRVIAVNSGGEGAPQDLDNYITAMPPPVRPKFTDTKMKTFMVVRAGNAVRINLNFEASPWPEVVWLKDGMTLPKHVTISNTEGMSQLLIPTSERSDSGVYSIIIKNLVGQESLSVEIRVTDDPKPPGPVELEENVPGTVTVRWEPSKDEKCDDRLHYLVSKRDSSKQTWHTVADRLFNNQFTACNIVPGHEYRFRIYAKNDIGLSDFSESPIWGTTRKKEKFVVSTPECRPCNLESAPAFLVPLKMHVAPKGYECYMNCAVTGNPQPHITWYHNNVSLNTNTNYYISNTCGVCSMLIMRVGTDNRGEYTVMAENKLGKAECSTKLTVRE